VLGVERVSVRVDRIGWKWLEWRGLGQWGWGGRGWVEEVGVADDEM
jgi:hypothetical protein